jgi:hypothetical protein
MTRVFLAAGVAALAIAAPASAGPHGGGGGKDRQATVNQTQARADRQAARAERQAARQQAAPRVDRQAARMERQQARVERVAPTRVERQQARVERVAPTRVERQQARVERQQRVPPTRIERQQQVQTRQAERQQIRANRTQIQPQTTTRQQVQANQQTTAQTRLAQRQELRAQTQSLLVQRQALRADRIANADAFRASRLAALTAPTVTTRTVTQVVAPAQVVQYVGQPVSTVTNYVPLMALPSSVNYLYPATPDYYYQYGGGYLYQVDRSSSLIAALIPLLAGGFLPGTYLPSTYMNSYAPSYYGLDTFYPANYGSGYPGYSNICNRYEYGVIYQVDCFTGMVIDVVPLYAGGYGVGQMLPSAYNYYNVPMQYRDLYYPTADASYWYAPGAIYQYDPSSSLITSVAALMSPGFSVGQPLPMGYSAYNVPYAYRATYYDTPNAWYRYNNGYIYQVDPTTQLVTAIVASLLT